MIDDLASANNPPEIIRTLANRKALGTIDAINVVISKPPKETVFILGALERVFGPSNIVLIYTNDHSKHHSTP